MIDKTESTAEGELQAFDIIASKFNPFGSHTQPDGIPIVDATTFTCFGALMASMMSNEIPIPCWIRVGRSRHKVTLENKAGIEKGLFIALEMRLQRLQNREHEQI